MIVLSATLIMWSKIAASATAIILRVQATERGNVEAEKNAISVKEGHDLHAHPTSPNTSLVELCPVAISTSRDRPGKYSP